MGPDVGVGAKRAVDGVIEAGVETGGNVLEITKAATTGAIEAAGTIGTTAVTTMKDILLGVVAGVKEVAGAALPHASSQSQPTQPK